jgi:hypothetical protein
MLHAFGPFFPIPLPYSLRLSVTHSHQTGRVDQLQFFSLNSRQHFDSS